MRANLLIILYFWVLSLHANEQPQIRVGVLSFGTVNWELDVINHHKLDEKLNFELITVPLSNKSAAAIALQSGSVDVILTDVFWVAKQADDYKIVPTHQLSGGIYANASVTDVSSLSNIGVAGGANDKNWLLFQAYQQHINEQLAITPKFAAPPLLNAMLKKGQIESVINFWHYNARLEAGGYKSVLSTKSMLNALGVDQSVALLGWVFHKDFAANSPDVLHAFLKASKTAKSMMLSSDKEWDRLRPKMRAKTEAEFAQLVTHYPTTLMENFDKSNVVAFESLFNMIKQLPDQTLFTAQTNFPEDIFYKAIK